MKIDLSKDVEQFKKFAFGKNMMGVAVALVLATAFQKTVSAFTDNLFMPIINYFVNRTGGNWRKMSFSPVEDMNLEIGQLIGSVLEFALTSLLLYIIYYKVVKLILPNVEDVSIPHERR